MNTRKDRILETLLILGLPMAIGVGCAADGNQLISSKTAFVADQEVNETIDGASQHVLKLKWDQLPFVEVSAVESAPQPATESMLADTEEATANTKVADEPETVALETEIQVIVADATMEDDRATNEVGEDAVPEKQMFFFGVGSHQVAEKDLAALRAHAEILRKNPSLRVTVIGHTDSQGSKQFNAKLSEQRAQAVVNILTTFGVPESQLMTSSYGASLPLQDIAKYAENRRVELKYDDAILLSASE